MSLTFGEVVIILWADRLTDRAKDSKEAIFDVRLRNIKRSFSEKNSF
jgi:hypothetical protein